MADKQSPSEEFRRRPDAPVLDPSLATLRLR